MKKCLFVIVAVFVLLSACTQASTSGGYTPPSDDTTGKLEINLFSDMTRTITPSLSMTVSTYDIIADGPVSSDDFTVTDVTDSSVIRNNLTPGSWTITVQGRNSAGTLIAENSASCMVTAGSQTDVSITVLPLTGTGDFSLEVSWPSGSITTPSADCTIIYPDGTTTAEPACTVSGLTASGSLGNLATGYYSLFVNLYDSSTKVWGNLDTFRIVSGQTTEASLSASLDADADGDISITISVDLQNPIEIAFSGSVSTLSSGSDMTVTAVTTDEDSNTVVVDSYKWYLDGEEVSGATAATITTGSALSAGKHRLDLLVKKGVVLSSEGFSFTVQ